MRDFNESSRYWLSPGIDAPTRSEILPGLRPMRGLYVHVDAGEAVFVPTDDFMRATPLWRLDVLGDIAQAVERTQQHAAVDYFRRLNQRRPDLTMDRRLAAFRRVCDEGGVVLPPNVEAPKKKIEDLYLKDLAKDKQQRFRVFQIGAAAKIKKTDAAIEELFTDEYYVDMANTAYGVKIDMTELPKDGSDMITKRLEPVMKQKYGYEFDKGRVVAEMLKRFDNWREAKDLPPGTADRAAQLFKTINAAFNVSGK